MEFIQETGVIRMTHSSRRVNALASRLNARRYLEIGVSTGQTFRHVDIAERTGVDPAFEFDTREIESEAVRCIPITSDDFFVTEPVDAVYDIVFIDGLHTFEQVVRDLANVLLRTHSGSAIILDDTLPSDVYSALPSLPRAFKFRDLAGDKINRSWHGDVFKIVFYIHDFCPSLNYRTIVGSGNSQTLVWRTNGESRKPLFNNLEKISRLDYFDMYDNIDILRESAEWEAIELCINEIDKRK